MPPFLLPDEPVTSLDQYLAGDGGLGLARAVDLGPAQTIKEISLSRLRGRGGAGFPTGGKWATIAEAGGTHRYVVCNGAEGEPGTFKDRELMRRNPYQLVEGLVVAGFAVGAREAFIGVKERFTAERENVIRAVEEMQTAGICKECTVSVVAGPDEYLFGEEKALLEGRRIKAVFSGVANTVLTGDKLATPLTYEDMQAAGAGLGAAGFIVYDDTACMVEVGRQLSRFLAIESCGQCPPCKQGSQE